MTDERGERLQKVLAHAGVASRRAAEELILAGRVAVNGEVVRELGRRVLPGDRIAVDGRPLAGAERLVHLALYKPVGYVSTARDPEGRPTVLQLVPGVERIYPVGRLDWDSEGLLLMTNDGEMANRLMHPRFGVEKEYHALVAGYPSSAVLQQLADGVQLDDGMTAPAVVRRLRQTRDGIWISVTIQEGRNRQVRRMFDAVKHPVKQLVRVRFGPVTLERLTPGQSRPLRSDELRLLKDDGGAPSPERKPTNRRPRDVRDGRSSAPAS